MLILIGGEKDNGYTNSWFRMVLNPDHMPLIIGIEKGWFADAQLDVHMIEPEAHFDALSEIENNKMDIAITEPIHLLKIVLTLKMLLASHDSCTLTVVSCSTKIKQ